MHPAQMSASADFWPHTGSISSLCFCPQNNPPITSGWQLVITRCLLLFSGLYLIFDPAIQQSADTVRLPGWLLLLAITLAVQPCIRLAWRWGLALGYWMWRWCLAVPCRDGEGVSGGDAAAREPCRDIVALLETTRITLSLIPDRIAASALEAAIFHQAGKGPVKLLVGGVSGMVLPCRACRRCRAWVAHQRDGCIPG